MVEEGIQWWRSSYNGGGGLTMVEEAYNGGGGQTMVV